MSRELMVVLIVAIVMFASVMRARYGHRRRSERGIEQGAGAAAENQRLRDEVKQLRDRLAVLERIAVEKENSLEREIEALRDQR
jgi:uncharacterized protein YlxW (UPF0749 family)